MSRAIYWFRNDLRLEDNEVLNKAVEENPEVLPVYVFDESLLRGEQWGIERMGSHRLKFLLESLEDLKAHLQQLGSDLLIKVGDTVTVLNDIRKTYNCDVLYAQKSSAYDEE